MICTTFWAKRIELIQDSHKNMYRKKVGDVSGQSFDKISGSITDIFYAVDKWWVRKPIQREKAEIYQGLYVA